MQRLLKLTITLLVQFNHVNINLLALSCYSVVFQMKKELDAFDPNFFEELEDLKYNYQEAVKRNVQYEEQLNSLAKQYGFPLDT